MANAGRNSAEYLLPMLLLMLSGCRSSEPTPPVIQASPKKTYYNLGITRQPVTVLVPIAPGEEARYLVVDNPHINKLTVGFTHHPDSIITGDHLPSDRRPIRHRLFVVPIPAATRPDTAMVTLAKTGENLSFHLKLYDARQWQRFRD